MESEHRCTNIPHSLFVWIKIPIHASNPVVIGDSETVSWWRHQREKIPHHWPFVRGIHRWPVNSPHKGQWRGALMFSLICAWIHGWVNNREADDLKRYRTHYDVIVMCRLHIPHPKARSSWTDWPDFSAPISRPYRIMQIAIISHSLCGWK